MKNFAFIILLLSLLNGCDLIDKIEKASDTVDDIELRYDKKQAINKTEYALSSVKEIGQLKNISAKQLKDADLKIDEAISSVLDYQNSSSGNKLDKISAGKALQHIEYAKKILGEHDYKNSLNELHLAVKYLVNDKIAAWQYQKRGKHKFPDYLKYGSTISNGKNIIENPDTLVFSGGGARGIAYAGVLKYLQKNDKLDNVERFIGTSAGSIICSFMSFGSYYEKNRQVGDRHFWEIVYEIISEQDLFDFIDNPILQEVIKADSFEPVTGNLLVNMPPLAEAMDTQYALCSGDVILKFFKESFKRFGIDENITLGEHYKKTGKHLVLVSCSLSYSMAAYLDYKNSPDLPLVDAMRASMAIPYVYKPIKYNNDFFVDGGAANNYPIEYFDYSMAEEKKKPVTLGFMLFTKKEMLRPEWKLVQSPLGYTLALLKLVAINTGRSLFDENIDRTVFIDCCEIDILTFDMTQEQKLKLMESGYIAVKSYYEK
ncbi:MAG TPA: patatin-like phospholipase family protein [Victivallales bacterium]|nr:patatin-like phospholipase family protein [Victivallales bacterium]